MSIPHPPEKAIPPRHDRQRRFGGCCDVLNFFETAENAERYLRAHPDIKGAAITIPEAAEAGRVVFGDVLTGEK